MGVGMNLSVSEDQIGLILSECLIDKLEKGLSEMPQADIPVISGNVSGMYTREIIIKKDTVLTGRVHMYDYVDIMLSGDITICNTLGLRQRFTGANVFHGKAGTKRAGYAHEDTRWITVHNIDVSSGDYYFNNLTFQTLDQYRENFDVRHDFNILVSEMGISFDEVNAVVENELDMIEVDGLPVAVGDSGISGKGLFALIDFEGGQVICKSRIGNNITIAGRYANHEISPNAMMAADGENINLVATRYIRAGEEITTNYRDTIRRLTCQQ